MPKSKSVLKNKATPYHNQTKNQIKDQIISIEQLPYLKNKGPNVLQVERIAKPQQLVTNPDETEMTIPSPYSPGPKSGQKNYGTFISDDNEVNDDSIKDEVLMLIQQVE